MDQADSIDRVISLTGRVQGVGMRPYLYRQARALDLCGETRNTGTGLELRIRGSSSSIERLLQALSDSPPRDADIQDIHCAPLEYRDCPDTFIVGDSLTMDVSTPVPPDRATCPQCMEELLNPANRRYRHPFISCTECGPRHSILTALPWDRCRNSMQPFAMCAACRKEMAEPDDRRFHSQTNCCHQCGPRLYLLTPEATTDGESALAEAISIVQGGGLIAAKGPGGFQLVCRADYPPAIQRIRHMKSRQRKPLALMFSTVEAVDKNCHLSAREQELLESAAAPIVLLQKKSVVLPWDESVAPGLDRIGAMLPATGLQHLLLHGVKGPLVVTSANLRGEPLCYDNDIAIKEFARSTDAVLYHDRDIHHPLDDSILQVTCGQEMMLRRARGYDLELDIRVPERPTAVAVGADLKSCAALNVGNRMLSAPHTGSLNSLVSEERHLTRIRDLCQLYALEPAEMVSDCHPAYHSRELAKRSGLPVHEVQHHRAHLYAGLAECQNLDLPALAVCWDGTGYGTDASLWGGEFFYLDRSGDRRCAHLLPFRLPGGEEAIRQPRRTALSLLYNLYGDTCRDHPLLPAFEDRDLKVLLNLLERGLHTPSCSSVGRLFDGVASLLGCPAEVDYEGEAAIHLEQLAQRASDTGIHNPWPIPIDKTGAIWQLDWRPLLQNLTRAAGDGGPAPELAARFHASLAHAILRVARELNCASILLTGGCFQNQYLLNSVCRLANEQNLMLSWPRVLPPGDGAIAIGQLYALLNGVTDP